MADRKGIERILEYFGEGKTIITIGFLCFVYFILHFLRLGWIGRILPDLPSSTYITFAFGVFGYQIYAWRRLKLFQGNWYKAVTSWVLFFSEFWLILFSVSFLSWPIYFLSTFIEK